MRAACGGGRPDRGPGIALRKVDARPDTAPGQARCVPRGFRSPTGIERMWALSRGLHPAPPSPPETSPRVEVPVYETPDPWARSFPASAFTEIQEREHGLATMRGRGEMSMPASE